MNQDISQYAKLGLAHFMLWPRCIHDTDQLTRTLTQLVGRDDFETVDCALPFGRDHRLALSEAVRASGLEIGYAPHGVPPTVIPLAAAVDNEEGLVQLAIEDQLEASVSVGATRFTIVSGPRVAVGQRSKARGSFARLCRWAYNNIAGSHEMKIVIEPFDHDFDKQFPHGPTDECIELVNRLPSVVDNLGIQLDMAHLPLMGETFEDAIRTVGDHLCHVHLGNCVVKDVRDPFHGDKHPPIGYPGGEIDVPQPAEILTLPVETGYLNTQHRGTLVMGMQTFPGKSVDETIQDTLGRLDIAWRMAG